MKIKKIKMQPVIYKLLCDRCDIDLTNQYPTRVHVENEEYYLYVCPLCGDLYRSKEYFGALRYEEVAEDEEV